MKLMKILPMKVATGTETLRSKRRKKRKNEWIRLGKNQNIFSNKNVKHIK